MKKVIRHRIAIKIFFTERIFILASIILIKYFKVFITDSIPFFKLNERGFLAR
jgi:hypothetical protein